MSREPLTKTCFPIFRYTDLDALCRYLERQEANGWRLIDAYHKLRFQKCEPRTVRYAAEVFEKAPRDDSAPLPFDAQEFIGLCEQANWTFVANNRYLYVFRTEDPQAPPIHTDQKEKLRMICRAERRSFIWGWVILLLALLGILALSIIPFPYSTFNSYPALLELIAFSVAAVVAAYWLIAYLI